MQVRHMSILDLYVVWHSCFIDEHCPAENPNYCTCKLDGDNCNGYLHQRCADDKQSKGDIPAEDISSCYYNRASDWKKGLYTIEQVPIILMKKNKCVATNPSGNEGYS